MAELTRDALRERVAPFRVDELVRARVASRGWLYDEIKAGHIRVVRVGRHVRVPVDEVARLVGVED